MFSIVEWWTLERAPAEAAEWARKEDVFYSHEILDGVGYFGRGTKSLTKVL